MNIEIERKFLVDKILWDALDKPVPTALEQGYIYSDIDKTIRVRIADDKAYLTIKGAARSISRSEYEYEIPVVDATQMLAEFTTITVSKHRYEIPLGEHIWEVDVFYGANAGLLVAEIELSSEDEVYSLPPWIGAEVTADKRYANSNLIQHPFQNW